MSSADVEELKKVREELQEVRREIDALQRELLEKQRRRYTPIPLRMMRNPYALPIIGGVLAGEAESLVFVLGL